MFVRAKSDVVHRMTGLKSNIKSEQAELRELNSAEAAENASFQKVLAVEREGLKHLEYLRGAEYFNIYNYISF